MDTVGSALAADLRTVVRWSAARADPTAAAPLRSERGRSGVPH